MILPTHETLSSNTTPQPKVEPPRGGNETILLVEDDAILRKNTSRSLQRWGYQVLEATNGLEALQLWPERHQHVDLLLTDMVMPEGINGLALAEKLRASKPTLRVIVSSGYSAELVQNAGAIIEGIDYLPKPCAPAELATTIRRCLDRPQR
jgi:CheY-like chemotaxis protein